jgi:two-component SAPR family response regulator
MARFSQEFLRAMANPTFGRGLFTAAQQAARLPVELQQQQQAQQMRQQLAQIDTNSPEGLLRLAQFYRQQGDVANAVKYEEAARKLQAQVTAETAFGARKTSLAAAATT